MVQPRDFGLPIIFILLGFGLRVHELQAVPLRGDEAFSVLYWADTPLQIALSDIAPGEPHTPLVYVIGRLWNFIVGGIDSIFAMRFLSVLGNSVGIAAMFALAWRLSRNRACALLAALMFAVHPYEIWHSQEFRNYAYWGGLSVTALWLGLRLADGPRRSELALYGLIGGIAALTIYTEWFTTIALTCYAIMARWRDWQFLRRLLGIQLVMAILLIAGLVLIQVQAGFTATYPGLVQAFSIPDYVTRFVPVLLLGNTLPLNQAALGLGLTLVCGLYAALILRRSPRQFCFLTLTGLLPLILLGAVSQRYNLFHPRYVLSAVPAFILVLALGSLYVAGLIKRLVRVNQAMLAAMLLIPWFALAGTGLNAHFNDPAFRRAPAWDELGAFLNRHVNEDDLVIQLAVDPAFGYYYEGSARDIGLPVKPYQPVEEIWDELEALSMEYASIYVVAREQAGWPNAGAVDAWMQENMQEVLRTDASGLPIRQYMSRAVEHVPELESARFGHVVALLDWDACAMWLPSGDMLVRLNWKPLSHTALPFKTFIHVYGAPNPQTGSVLWSQDDRYPQAGRLSSTSWSMGEAFRDTYYLPGEKLLDGRYEIHVGWYDPSSGQRVSLSEGGDTYSLCSMDIVRSN